jgi:hypothetical protein
MELRRAFRYPTDLDASCRAGEHAWQTRLRNLSVGGCMIESPDPGFAVGSPLRLWISGVPTIDGTIAWQHRGHAGIRFLSPLPPTVMDRLGCRPDAVRGGGGHGQRPPSEAAA